MVCARPPTLTPTGTRSGSARPRTDREPVTTKIEPVPVREPRGPARDVHRSTSRELTPGLPAPRLPALRPPDPEGGQPIGRRRRADHLDLRPERRLPLRAAHGIGQEFLDLGEQLSGKLGV